MISQSELCDEACRLLGKEVAINVILTRKNAELEAELTKRNAEELLHTLTDGDPQSIVSGNEG